MHMDRSIFDLNAGVDATSLYILICALLDQGESPSLNRAKLQWNGTEEGLMQAAHELMDRGVLEEMRPIDPNEPVRITPRSKWR